MSQPHRSTSTEDRLAGSDAIALAELARPERRDDGPAKVTGATRYAGDRTLPGTLWAAFLGSPVAHGRILRVDVGKARAAPGVHAVVTGADATDALFGRQLLDRPVLARDRVRFVGDRIAGVAADTPEAAEAALALIEVEVEELEPLLDPEMATAPGAPILHPGAASYVYLAGQRPPVPHPNIQGVMTIRRGADDIEAVFATAHRVFEHTFTTPRQHHGYIEPHATLVWIDADDVVHIVTTNKAPPRLHSQFAATFGLDPVKVVIEAGAVGGDFGGKGYSIDEFACYLLARSAGRPVRAVTRYADEFAAVNVRHASRFRLRTAVDAEGRLLAHQADILYDGGAYASAKPMATLVPGTGGPTMAPYRVPNVQIDIRTVYTNTMPGGHMRAPGEHQGHFATESHLDAIARELGEDPLAFRLRNVVRGDEPGATGTRYREARAVDVLETAATAIGWGSSVPAGRGRGIALGMHHVGGAGVGPVGLKLRLHADGMVDVFCGMTDQGGGLATVVRRVIAASAGIGEARIRYVRLTTAEAPINPGVGGSWGTHLAGGAAFEIGRKLRTWIDERLPRAMPAVPPDAVLRDDKLVDKHGRELMAFAELVGRIVEPEAYVELESVYAPPAREVGEPADVDFSACAVEVAVDPDTGAITIENAVMAADVGTVVNPVAHAGQIDGAFAFGVGAALMEELVVEGGVLVASTFGEVKFPTIRDVPPLRQILLPTTIGPGPFGAKAVGELTNAPVAPAIANAVSDATGVRIVALPLTPERVLMALRERSRSAV